MSIGSFINAKRFKNIALTLLLVFSQTAFAFSPFVQSAIVEAALLCQVDIAGANDEPGQKDLTQMCVDYNGLPATIDTTWNWDDLGTSGANTLDACNLFDTDGDGKANFAVCVTTQGNPASIQNTTTYQCNDSRKDRCAGKTLIANGATTCDVYASNTDPFPNGDGFPVDIQGSCTIDLSTIGGSSANLIDVCSYPSQEPNSDPSDCVIFTREAIATVKVVKSLFPVDDDGLFNLYVDGPADSDTTTVNNVGHNGTTGNVNFVLTGNGANVSGTVTVGETAGTNTDLSSYASNISCRDDGGLGDVVAHEIATSLSFSVADGDSILCTILNTASGSITIVKDAVPNNSQDFSFTTQGEDISDFNLDDDGDSANDLSNTQTFTNLSAGSYTFTESQVEGWYLGAIDCPNITETKDIAAGTVTLTIAAGQHITCTFTNRKLGQIIVTKQTQPDGDATNFAIATTPESGVVGNASQLIADDETETFVVKHGTYAVTETVPQGWAQISNTCSNLVIDGNSPLVSGIPTRTCTIENTKLGSIEIIKNALPDNEQDFSFTFTGNNSNGIFGLDDDAGADDLLLNSIVIDDLLPGNYSVTEQSTPGWKLTDITCRNQSQDGATANITLAAGENVSCTFENTKLVTISGTKFEVNADATPLTALGGWKIILDLDGSGTLTDGDREATTANDGSYSFDNVLFGTNVSLFEILQDGWTQIFSPEGFTVASADDIEDLDFGNFNNATISGYKWNDQNGNGVDDTEPKLNGWTINLHDKDNIIIDSTVTANSGLYSFTDVAPGDYSVCEDISSQNGWVQTFPTQNACHDITIDVSGETETANFGNQGRGSITVNKNVDSDGDGQVDVFGATDWTWDIANGAQNTATGSSQSIAAGSYTINEDQQTNYHVTDLTCDSQSYGAVESSDVVVAPGQSVVCTFTNTRDTATVRVEKELNPVDDDGLFDLYVGETLVKEDASHNEGGITTILTNQDYTVKELAGTDTDLADYNSSYRCSTEQSGDGTSVTINASSIGAEITCTFTNVRRADVSIVKNANPADGTDFDFAISKISPFEDIIEPTLSLFELTNIKSFNDGEGSFTLDDDGSKDDGDSFGDTQELSLSPGTYYVSEEDIPDNWRLKDVSCTGIEIFPVEATVLTLNVEAGAQIECTFSNEKYAEIVVTKFNDYNRDGEWDEATEPTLSNWDMNLSGSNDCNTEQVIELLLVRIPITECVPFNYNRSQTTEADGSTIFNEVRAGIEYNLSETLQSEWTLSNIYCGEYDPENVNDDNNYLVDEEALEPGQPLECYVGNFQDSELNLTKSNNQTAVGSPGDIVTYTLTVTVPEDVDELFGAEVIDLPPENVDVIEGTETASSNKTGNIAVSPSYASPGTWGLGDLVPGEVVTLTYDVQISRTISSGEYPDIAYATAYDSPDKNPERLLFANASADEPFVGTDIAVAAPAPPQLANTGMALQLLQFVVPMLAFILTLTLVQYPKKGGRA